MVLILGGLLIAVVAGLLLRAEQRCRTCLAYSAGLPQGHSRVPISIVKPVKGADEFTPANFTSWARQQYAAPIQLVFSFEEAHDPALSAAEQLDAPVKPDIIFNRRRDGFSGKMSNVFHGLQVARHDFLVLSDADIEAAPDTCSRIMEQARRGVDVVSCLPVHDRARNVWGRIYAAFWNFEILGFVAPTLLREGSVAMGGTLGMWRQTLETLGGLEAFKAYVAEDLAMGQQAKAKGLRVGLGPLVRSPVGRKSFGELKEKFSRAAMHGHTLIPPGERLQHTVLTSYLFVLALSAIFQSGPGLAVGIGLLCARLVFARRFWALATGEKRIPAESVVGDVLFLSAFARGFFVRRMRWGGVEYHVDRDGRLVALGEKRG